MNSEKRWIGIFSALLLLLGIFVGIAMDRFLFRPPPPPPAFEGGGAHGPGARSNFFLERLTSELDLTDAQRAKVAEIFRRNIPLLRAARHDREEFRKARRRLHDELAGVLSEEQLRQLDALRRRDRDARRRERGLPPGPGAAPPPSGK